MSKEEKSDHDLLHEIAIVVKRIDAALNNHLGHHRAIAVTLIGVTAAAILTALFTVLLK